MSCSVVLFLKAEFMHSDYDLYYVDNIITQACQNSLVFQNRLLNISVLSLIN